MQEMSTAVQHELRSRSSSSTTSIWAMVRQWQQHVARHRLSHSYSEAAAGLCQRLAAAYGCVRPPGDHTGDLDGAIKEMITSSARCCSDCRVAALEKLFPDDSVRQGAQRNACCRRKPPRRPPPRPFAAARRWCEDGDRGHEAGRIFRCHRPADRGPSTPRPLVGSLVLWILDPVSRGMTTFGSPMFDLAQLDAPTPSSAGDPPTPAHAWPLLSERLGTGSSSSTKPTPIGAFKVRGGLVYVDRLTRERPDVAGLISATRGNHGQSLAFAARRYRCGDDSTAIQATPSRRNRAHARVAPTLVEHGDWIFRPRRGRRRGHANVTDWIRPLPPCPICDWGWRPMRSNGFGRSHSTLLYCADRAGLRHSAAASFAPTSSGLNTEIVGVQSNGGAVLCVVFGRHGGEHQQQQYARRTAGDVRVPDADRGWRSSARAPRTACRSPTMKRRGDPRRYWTTTHKPRGGRRRRPARGPAARKRQNSTPRQARRPDPERRISILTCSGDGSLAKPSPAARCWCDDEEGGRHGRLVPAIHVFLLLSFQDGMPGTKPGHDE